MLRFKDLGQFNEVEFYWEGFEKLQNLYLDGSLVIIGYRGNLYSVNLVSVYDIIWGSYIRTSVFDLVNNRTVGDGTFDMAFYRADDSDLTPRVREAIQDAIIKINMKPTDFYK